jgi:PhnB protein
MAIKNINPYLNFDGTAEQAIALYQRALGATYDRLMRFGDAQGTPIDPAYKDRIMHVSLRIGEGIIMLSDTMPGMPVARDSNTHVILEFDDPADETQKFNALAAGGTITMPLQDTFWGAKFGMLTDAFGIHWMFHCELKKS